MNISDQRVLVAHLKKRQNLLGSASNSSTSSFVAAGTYATFVASLGSAAFVATSTFSTAAQGAKADTALQSVPDASTSVKGLVKKAAVLTAAPPITITDSTGGSVSTTLAAITGAVYADDSAIIKNALASIADNLNKANARLEDLIAKQQTAGQQT